MWRSVRCAVLALVAMRESVPVAPSRSIECERRYSRKVYVRPMAMRGGDVGTTQPECGSDHGWIRHGNPPWEGHERLAVPLTVTA